MRITSFEAENILSFSEFKLTNLNKDLNIIVGPNNCGKTNFFRVLKIISELSKSPFNSKKEWDVFTRDKKSNKSFTVKVGLEFNEKEVSSIQKLLELCIRYNFLRLDVHFLENTEINRYIRKLFSNESSVQQLTKSIDPNNEKNLEIFRTIKSFAIGHAEKIAKAVCDSISKGTIVLRYEGPPNWRPELSYDFRIDNKRIAKIFQRQNFISSESTLYPQEISIAFGNYIGQILTDKNTTPEKLSSTLNEDVETDAFLKYAFDHGGLGKIEISSSDLNTAGTNYEKAMAELYEIIFSLEGEFTDAGNFYLGRSFFKMIPSHIIFTDELRIRPRGEVANLEMLGHKGDELLKLEDLSVLLLNLRNSEDPE